MTTGLGCEGESVALTSATNPSLEDLLTELATAEQLFRGAFDGSPIGMAQTDGDGRFVRVNQALCELTGRTRQQLGGQRFDALTHPGDTGRDKLAIAALLSGERRQYKAETRFAHVSGTPIWVALQATTIHNGVEDTGRRFLLQVQDAPPALRGEPPLPRQPRSADGSAQPLESPPS
jgi:PAS domain S-box-containing protein